MITNRERAERMAQYINWAGGQLAWVDEHGMLTFRYEGQSYRLQVCPRLRWVQRLLGRIE